MTDHPDRRLFEPVAVPASTTSATATAGTAAAPSSTAPADTRIPALYLGHGAPPLLEDGTWMAELSGWAASLPRPKAILIVSAHWESAPMSISSTHRVPLVYDFYGFPEHYYRMTYDAPGAPELAASVRGLMPSTEPVLERETRGLDHGAWVPLMAM
jgi:4,5-DOPA dioxygenase extradiol